MKLKRLARKWGIINPTVVLWAIKAYWSTVMITASYAVFNLAGVYSSSTQVSGRISYISSGNTFCGSLKSFVTVVTSIKVHIVNMN